MERHFESSPPETFIESDILIGSNIESSLH